MSLQKLLLAAVVAGGVALSVAPAAIAAPATTRIAGTVSYTTADGRHRFARSVSVEVRDADGSAHGTLLKSGTTDDSGIFSFTVSTTRANGTPRKPQIRALTRTSGATVHAVGTAAPYALVSTPTTATGATQTVKLVAGTATPDGSAFDVVDALVTGVAYGRRVAGTLPALSVVFPDPTGTNSTAGVLKVRLGERFDWDVLLHEFGHFVALNTGIDTSPAGDHFFGRNLGEPPRSKSAGIRLAWSEGFATYFALTAQDVLGVSALKIPGAGDAFFDDTEDANEHVPIGTDDAIASVGEDDELSVARTLWHFRVDARTQLPDRTLFTALRTARATTLSTAVAALLPAAHAAPFGGSGHPSAAEVAHSNDFACVLGRQAVAPLLTAPSAGTPVSPTVPPTFTWNARGAGPSHRSNRFVLQVWSPDWSTARFTSPTLTATTLTPTAKQWKNVVKPDDSAVHIVVRGSGADAPKTGPYDSCALDLAPAVALTATPLTNTLHPPAINPTCAGLAAPQESMFNVTASELTPNATYDVVLHAEDNSIDRVLTHATTNAAGVLPTTLAIVPGVPSGRTWDVVARPRVSGDLSASVQRPIGGFTCVRGNPGSPGTLSFGGSGAVTGTTVTEFDGSTPLGSATADATGNYVGSFPISCSGQKTLQARYTDLDGPAAVNVTITCPA